MTRDRVLLAVDLSYQTYRATAAHRQLTCDGQFTGGLYGFLVSLAKQVNVTHATHVVVCEDVKPYLRSEVYPEYKLLRKKNADEELKALFQESLPMVLEALDVIGIPVMGFKGFESDDGIGWLATTHRHRFHRIYGSSNDSDLYQLLRFDNFRLLKGGDMTEIVDRAKVFEQFGVDPEGYMLAQALKGTHNDVAGIPGVGEGKAFAAVKDPGQMRRWRERWAELIDRNQELQRLPHPKFPHTTLPGMGTFKARALYKFCGRYDIEVTGAMISAFESICP